LFNTSPNTNTKLGILGNLAIGSQTYSDAQAPTNGLIVEGNVGIGTTNPEAKLHINVSDSSEGLIINSNSNYKLGLFGRGSFTTTYGDGTLAFGVDSSTTDGRIILKGRYIEVGDSDFFTNNTYTKGTYNQTLFVQDGIWIGSGNGRGLHFVGNQTNGIKILGGNQVGNYDFEIGHDKAGYDIVFSTSPTIDATRVEQMRITSNGNIGIGTTAPANKLDVNGTVEMTGFKMTTSPSAGYVLQSDAYGVGEWADVSSSAGPWTLSGNNLYPDSTSYNVAIGATDAGNADLYVNGNVGIGTTGPSQKLDVVGSIEQDGGTYTATLSSGSTLTGSNHLILNAATSYLRLATANGQMYFRAGAGHRFQNGDGTSDWMKIDTSGNVGIGTTEPAEKLEISSGNIKLDQNQYIKFGSVNTLTTSSSGNTTLTSGPSGAGQGALTIAGNNDIRIAVSTSNNLILKTNGGNIRFTDNAESDLVRITSAGNVGIGTTDPGAKLEVNGQVKITGGSPGSNKVLTSDGDGLATWKSISGSGGVTGTGSAGQATFWTDSSIVSGDDAFWWDNSNKRLGIGTTEPGFKLSVAQDMTMGNDITDGTAQMVIQGATTSGKKMILGYDTNSNGFGYIKAGNQGVAWTNLALQPNGGNVGIGTASPRYKLVVQQDQSDGYEGQLSLQGATDSNQRLFLGYNTASDYGKIYAVKTGTGYRNLVLQEHGGNVGIGTTAPATILDVDGIINATTGYRIANTATSGNYLRGNGTNFVSSAIQVADVPTLNQNTTGYADTLHYEDNRTISPSELSATRMKFGFTSYTNNSSSPWADFLHFRSYTDSSGGKDNLLVINRSGGFGMR